MADLFSMDGGAILIKYGGALRRSGASGRPADQVGNRPTASDISATASLIRKLRAFQDAATPPSDHRDFTTAPSAIPAARAPPGRVELGADAVDANACHLLASWPGPAAEHAPVGFPDPAAGGTPHSEWLRLDLAR